MRNKRDFNSQVHFVGRLTLIICVIGIILVPLCFSLVYDVSVDFSKIFEVALPPFLSYSVAVIIGAVATTPMVGGGAQYVASITGNVNNIKVPAAVNGMEMCEVQSGTDEGDTISLIAVCITSLVSCFIMILGMVFLAPIFKPVYESEFFSPAFGVVLPALYGAILTPYFLKGVKECVVPFVLPIVIILVIGRTTFSGISSYLMLALMVVAVIWVYLLHHKEIQGEKGKNDASGKQS